MCVKVCIIREFEVVLTPRGFFFGLIDEGGYRGEVEDC